MENQYLYCRPASRNRYHNQFYENASNEVIFVKDKTQIDSKNITTDPESEGTVPVYPKQYYALLPTDDEGKLIVSNSEDEIVKEIDSVIEKRKDSISLISIVAVIGGNGRPYPFRNIDEEINRAVELLKTEDYKDTEEIEIVARLLSDIGLYEDSSLFSREDLLEENASEIVSKRLISNYKNNFGIHASLRVNAKIINCSKEDIEQLKNLPEREWFPMNSQFQRNLFISEYGNDLNFRARINGLISPVIEMQRNYGKDELRYYMTKENGLEIFLNSVED